MSNTDTETKTPNIEVSTSPHLADPKGTTRRIMYDVLIGLVPAVVLSVVIFQWHSAVHLGICIVTCMATEWACQRMRGRRATLEDGAAIITGVILGLSLPASCPIFVPILGSIAAIALGKMVFGGLGCNLFNPAMVGRAFVMLSFAALLGSSSYVIGSDVTDIEVLTQATPLAIAKATATDIWSEGIWPLFLGHTNGSLGETSALMLLLGGIYLCVRRVAAWEIPAAMLAAMLVLGQLFYWMDLTKFSGIYQICSGAAMLGAFFIATDPVTSPMSFKGKVIYGAGIGVLTIIMRVFSGYTEGVMFAVLLMNAAGPLLNRWTIPVPLGGKPQPQEG